MRYGAGGLLLSGMVLVAAHATDRNILWNKTLECESAFLQQNTYAPCTLVSENEGDVLYKVDGERYQYLLLPLKKITGTEDAQLRSPGLPNYLFHAWQARGLVADKFGGNIAENVLSLAVNARNSRSQDQLHVHISCLAKPVHEALLRFCSRCYGPGWHTFPELLQGTAYQFMSLSSATFRTTNLFQLVYRRAMHDGQSMAFATFAVVNLTPQRFLLLLAFGDATHPVGAEHLQDHDCLLAEPARDKKKPTLTIGINTSHDK